MPEWVANLIRRLLGHTARTGSTFTTGPRVQVGQTNPFFMTHRAATKQVFVSGWADPHWTYHDSISVGRANQIVQIDRAMPASSRHMDLPVRLEGPTKMPQQPACDPRPHIS